MKKLLLGLAGVILLLLIFSLANPNYSEKRGALSTVGKSLFTSNYHHYLVAESAGQILQAQYNLAVIARASQYIGSLGSNTTTYRKIASIAAEADHECSRLELVLDLAVMTTSDSSNVLALGESACRIKSVEDELLWQKAYDLMLERAEFSSLEIALEKQKAH
jgi:hypothetical protein